MLFAKERTFLDLIHKMTSEAFLKRVAEKYHYLPEDMQELLIVAKIMKERILPEAFFDVGNDYVETKGEACRGVVISLGEGIDKLQDSYTQEGKLTESYMIEALGNELLLETYAVWNDWIEEKTDYHVAKYIFFGSNEKYPLEQLPGFLTRVSPSVTCNESYFMIPKKSVAFYASLTKEANIRCEGICQSCVRRDCPNRAKEEKWLPYGYARILGKEIR